MKQNKITIVEDESTGWMGIYINDKLMIEDHDLSITTVLDIIKFKYKYIETEIESSLPENLKDLKNGSS